MSDIVSGIAARHAEDEAAGPFIGRRSEQSRLDRGALLAEIARLREERRSISTLLGKVETLEADNTKLREERQGSRRAATSLRLLEFLRKDPRSRKLVVCCASIKSIKGEDAIGALNFEVEGKPFVVNFLWEDDLLGDIDRAVTSAIYAIEKEE